MTTEWNLSLLCSMGSNGSSKATLRCYSSICDGIVTIDIRHEMALHLVLICPALLAAQDSHGRVDSLTGIKYIQLDWVLG